MASDLQNGCAKKMQGSTLDMISGLPHNVIEEILMRMPIQDAVKTSVLSKKWRFAWVTLPRLVFDDAFYVESRRTPQMLMRTIGQVLLHHRGPILKFELSLSELESCPRMDQLILFLSKNGIQEFILQLPAAVTPTGGRYDLSPSIFSCLQLKHLKLRNCFFNPPLGFEGFSRLLSLELEEVSITSEVISSLISTCPLLEELRLVNCSSFGYLEVIAPNLTCLNFEGHFDAICYKNTPHLARVTVFLFDSDTGEDISKWVALFSGLPAIEFLELNYGCFELIPAGRLPRRLAINLTHLKILKLFSMYLEDANEVSNVLCLIRSAPNLEKIVILAYTEDEFEVDEPVVKLLEEQGWWDISLNRLREVELQPTSDKGFQLEFIKVLLATSPVLEKMVIDLSSLMFLERDGFLKEVAQFERLSPLAEVSYDTI